jgi:hypothetical protein
VCCCLSHEAALQAGLRGVPKDFLAPELQEFVNLVRNAITLSTARNGVPTLEGLGWFDIETPWDTGTTQRLIWDIYWDFADSWGKKK